MSFINSVVNGQFLYAVLGTGDIGMTRTAHLHAVRTEGKAVKHVI